jgi:hypothetical protein
LKSISLNIAAILGLLGGPPALAKTYDLAEIASGFAISGSIVTDGHFGTLSRGDILDWNLTVTVFSDGSSIPLNSGNSQFVVFGDGLSANTFNLFFNFSDPNPSFFFADAGENGQLGFDGNAGGGDILAAFGGGNIGDIFPIFGNLPFAIDPTPFADNATPLPATFPLFASGLATLGLLGWRRKKKAAALAA